MFRMLVGLGNGILTSSVYIVEVVSANRRGSVVMVRHAHLSQVENHLNTLQSEVIKHQNIDG